jgi:hypothetical protein
MEIISLYPLYLFSNFYFYFIFFYCIAMMGGSVLYLGHEHIMKKVVLHHIFLLRIFFTFFKK